MTIDEALERLVAKYDEAQGQEWIGDPLAWALHEVWKEADEERRQKHG